MCRATRSRTDAQLEIRKRASVTLVLMAALMAGAACATGATSATPVDPVVRGRALFRELGCDACHSVVSIPDTRKLGPSLLGVCGRETTLTNGRTVLVDAAYLQESITRPDASTVAGYGSGVMAAGLAGARDRLADAATVDALVAYLMSLR